ncbi:MAG: L,D-transpeptidase family protein [Planctomycetota bacterium]
MRDWIILLALAGLAFFGFRYCACSGPPDEAGASESSDASESEEGDVSLVRLESPTGEGQRPSPSPGGIKQGLRDELTAICRSMLADPSSVDLNRLQEIARQADSGQAGGLAAAITAACGRNRIQAWKGLSRVHEAGLLHGEEREALLAEIARQARLALRKPELSIGYRVVPGDSLARIRSRVREEHSLNVSPGMLRWVNDLRGDTIYPDQELRIPKEPLELWVSKELFLLRATVDGALIREYPVGLGMEDKTPTESFVLKAPIKEAPWKDPLTGKLIYFGEPGYKIGTRWIGFEPKGPHGGLGIHGTDEPESIGKAKSLGCIRMRNSDVEELAELVSAGNTVRIVD